MVANSLNLTARLLLLVVLLVQVGPRPPKKARYDFGKHSSGYLTFPLPRKQPARPVKPDTSCLKK